MDFILQTKARLVVRQYYCVDITVKETKGWKGSCSVGRLEQHCTALQYTVIYMCVPVASGAGGWEG